MRDNDTIDQRIVCASEEGKRLLTQHVIAIWRDWQGENSQSSIVDDPNDGMNCDGHFFLSIPRCYGCILTEASSSSSSSSSLLLSLCQT